MTPHPVRPGVQQHCSNIPLEEKRKRQDFLAWSQISLTEKLPFHQNALSLAANAAVWARSAPQEHLHPQCNQPPPLPQSRNALSCGALRNAATFRGGARPYSRHSAALEFGEFQLFDGLFPKIVYFFITQKNGLVPCVSKSVMT